MSRYSGVEGKRVLITGATGGLGFAMAQALASQGARVFVTGRDEGKLRKAIVELQSSPGECQGTVMDVRDEPSIRAGVAQMRRVWNGIDVLINNAGIGMRTVSPKFLTEPKLFWEISADGFRDLIDTNLTGYFLVAKEVVPHFLEAGTGRIINISINHETMRRRGFTPYGPSRAATESLSHIMAQDLEGSGVTVNLLLPGGAIATGMIPDEVPVPEALRPHMLSPHVMAEPALFLCSDEARGVNDQRIVAKDFPQWKAQWQASGEGRAA
jgi:NAD(P)-dependent dehydrogenase (short-subunit alcohol dehydrogenase family)